MTQFEHKSPFALAQKKIYPNDIQRAFNLLSVHFENPQRAYEEAQRSFDKSFLDGVQSVKEGKAEYGAFLQDVLRGTRQTFFDHLSPKSGQADGQEDAQKNHFQAAADNNSDSNELKNKIFTQTLSPYIQEVCKENLEKLRVTRTQQAKVLVADGVRS